MLAQALKERGIKRNIIFRPIDISAAGEAEFEAIYAKALREIYDFIKSGIEAASLDFFAKAKEYGARVAKSYNLDFEAVLKNEATFISRHLAASVKSQTGEDVTLLLRGIGDELDTVIEQSKLSLAKVIDDFIDGFQRDYLDFINLGSFRDEEFNDLSRSQKIQQRLRQKHTAAKKAAKQAARDKLGNANAKAKKTASKRLGLDLYVWRTMLDDKVRASHEEREGVIYNWNAPPEGGHPSEDWGCRCVAAPFYKGENDDTKDARPRFQCD